MSKTIDIAPGLKLPIDTVVQRKAIIAKNRVGKSNLGCAYVEEAHKAGVQSIILDPKGDWYGIRSSADGKGPGLPFLVMGGDRGDVPLDPSAGAVLGTYFGLHQADVVLDVSDFSKRDLVRFGADFLEALYDARKHNRVALNLVLEEAEDFAPQQIFDKDPNQYRCLGAVNKIAKKAGFLGIGLLLIAQRAASLNKNSLSQCDAIFFMRTTAPQDIKAADAWLQDQDDVKRKEVLTHIQGLPTGAAYVWAPEHGIFQKVQVRRRATFDAGFTPKVGESKPEPKVKAMVDLKAIMGEIQDTVEKAKADDPAVLKAKIRSLEKELANGSLTVKERVVEKQVPYVPDVISEMVEAARQEVQRTFENLFTGISNTVSEVRKGAKTVDSKTLGQPYTVSMPKLEDISQADRRARRIPNITVRPSDHSPPLGMSRVEQRILDEMADLASVGITVPDKVQLALFCGYTNARSGGFSEPVGRLVADGYLESPRPGHVMLTQKGQKAAKPASSPPSTEQLQQRLISKLDGVRGKILQYLIEIHPKEISREDLAAATGYTNHRSGGFSEPLGSLCSLGLADSPGRGVVRAANVLFLET